MWAISSPRTATRGCNVFADGKSRARRLRLLIGHWLVGGCLDPPERQRLAPFFSPLVTLRIIPGTLARRRITERGAVSAESGDNAGKSEKVFMTKPVGQGTASVGACFMAQDFDAGQDEGSSIIWGDQVEQLGLL